MIEDMKNYAAKWFDKGREHGLYPITKAMLADLEKDGEEICQHLKLKLPENPHNPKAEGIEYAWYCAVKGYIQRVKELNPEWEEK